MEKYEVKTIVNLPEDEIDNIQEQINAHNLDVIQKAYEQKRIGSEDYDYLLEFYHDGMGVYREVYRALFEMFKHPEYTCAIDLKTGKIDADSKGNPINYGLKAVTPFTCTRLEYVDKFKNPIYVIFPQMKTAERAIEKIESEYGKEYAQELFKAAKHVFENEDREAFCESVQKIQKNSTKLHDILRLTITCKYFTDVQRIKRVITENTSGFKRNFHINPQETRDRFLKPLSKNEKKYYDIKMIMHQKTDNGKNLDVEVQLKIKTLYDADLRTHLLYEQVRSLEVLLHKNAAQMENTEVRQKQAQIKILTGKIRKINENALHQYNMMVLDKARRIEDDGYRPLRVKPDYADGTYHECRHFISKEYMVESFSSFEAEKAFAANDDINKLCYLRMLGKVDTEFNEFTDNAFKTINYKFSRLSLSELERFKGITSIAQRYAPFIQRKINNQHRQETLGKSTATTLTR